MEVSCFREKGASFFLEVWSTFFAIPLLPPKARVPLLSTCVPTCDVGDDCQSVGGGVNCFSKQSKYQSADAFFVFCFIRVFHFVDKTNAFAAAAKSE